MLYKLSQFIPSKCDKSKVEVFMRNNFEIVQAKRKVTYIASFGIRLPHLTQQRRSRGEKKKWAIKVWSILDSIFLIVLSLKEIAA